MYTYAFLPGNVPSLSLPEGIVGPLQLVNTAHLSALVEPGLDVEFIQQSDERLIQAVLSHDRVVRQLFEQTVILPLRFGTCFVSEEGLVEHLQANYFQYLEKLNQLTGKAEYTLKCVPVDSFESEISSEVKGKDYFLAKKQRYQMQLEEQQRQQLELEALEEAIAQTYPLLVSEPKDNIERIYLLVPQQEEMQLLEHLKAWQTSCPGWDISLGEALPPYHFV